MKIKIISGSLSQINSTLDIYGHDHYIDDGGFLNVDEIGVECLEKILVFKYDIIEGKSITPKDIYLMPEK